MEENNNNNKKISYIEALIKYGKITAIIIAFLFGSVYFLKLITYMSFEFDSHKNKNNKSNKNSVVENNNNNNNSNNDEASNDINKENESTVSNSSSEANIDSNLFINGEEIDINLDLVQNLYHRVSNDYDTPICGFNANNNFYSAYANEIDKMNFVGIYLRNSNSRKTIDVSSIPKRGSNPLGYSLDVDNAIGYYYTRKQVEDAYHTLYGENVNFDNSFFSDNYLSVDYAGLNCFIYDKNTDLYYSYNCSGGLICYNKNLSTTKLSKALQNNDYIILVQDVSVYDDNNVSDKYQYVYTFKKEANGEYIFISKMKSKKD